MSKKEQVKEEQALIEVSEVNGVFKVNEATINLPALTNQEELQEILEENLGGLGPVGFDKVSIPSGGGISFTVIDESGEEEPVKEIRGVIIDKSPFKSWYIRSFDEKTEDDIGLPDCYSPDGITGTGCAEAGIPENQPCAACPKGQWGSDRRGGRGKDCADKIRLHILMEGDVFPKFIDLPPTSIGNFKDYAKRLANRLKPLYSVVTAIGLEKSKSGGGITYSRVTFAREADLTREERAGVRNYIQVLKPAMTQISRESIAEEAPAQATMSEETLSELGGDDPWV